jgi:hypothetical protein
VPQAGRVQERRVTFAPRRIQPGAHAPVRTDPGPLVDRLEERWCPRCAERCTTWAHDFSCLFCDEPTLSSRPKRRRPRARPAAANPVGRPRKFDWTEAMRLHNGGMTHAQVGIQLGASRSAVAKAITAMRRAA